MLPTGRIKIITKILSRAFRPDHPDMDFCARLYFHGKLLAHHLRQHAVLVSFDDKNRIPVGNPGKPVAVLERQRRGLVAVSAPVQVRGGGCDAPHICIIKGTALTHTPSELTFPFP